MAGNQWDHDNHDEDDTSNARSVFGTKDYWDELYLGRGDFPADEYTWYFGWDTYQKIVQEHVPNRQACILLPGIGNDPILLDLLQKGYDNLTATDYSEHAIARQRDLLSYQYSWDEDDDMDGSSGGGTTISTTSDGKVQLKCMDARKMEKTWTNRFDAVLEKGALDAIYLSGDGNLEATAQELKRVLKPGGILISISGVVPEELRRQVFGGDEDDDSWEWLRDGSKDLKAGCFVLKNNKL